MSKPSDGRVLLIIPTLGERAQLLRHAITSVVQQEGCDVDLVLVMPSGSPAQQIAEESAVRVVRDPGAGLSAALNAGIAAADPSCQYFAWLGDDDLLRPNALRAAVAALGSEPMAVMVYGRCDYVDDGGRTIFVSRAGPWAERLIGFGPNLIPQPGSLMRLDAVRAVGGLDEKLKFAMDLDLFLKLRHFGRLRALPQTLAAFRWHADSLTVANQKESIDEADRVRRRNLGMLASIAWPIWRWPVRWSLAAGKVFVKRRAAISSAQQPTFPVGS